MVYSERDKQAAMALLGTAVKKVTWPEGYSRTPQDIWDRLSPRWQEGQMELDENLVNATVASWNECAWVITAADAADHDQSVANPRSQFYATAHALEGSSSTEFADQMFDKLELGDTGDARSFILGNECDAVFKK